MEDNKYEHISTLLLKFLFLDMWEELQGNSTPSSTPGMRYAGNMNVINGDAERDTEENRRSVSLELAASRRAYVAAEQQRRRMPQIYADQIDEPPLNQTFPNIKVGNKAICRGQRWLSACKDISSTQSKSP